MSEPDGPAWSPVAGAEEPADALEIDDLDLLAETTHPIRGRILRRLKEPRSVAELAAVLEVPVTRLYHHVNKLDEHGLIRVVAIRRVAAVTERRYQVAARSFTLGHRLVETADDHEMAIALGSLFDVAKMALQREVEAGGYRSITDKEEHSALSLAEVHLSPVRRAELMSRLTELIHDFSSDLDEDDPTATRITLFVAAFPTTGS